MIFEPPPLPKRTLNIAPPQTNWHKVAELEIRLRELEIRRIEALAKLEAARRANKEAADNQ